MLKHGFSGILRDTQKNLQIFLEAFDLDELKKSEKSLIELRRENNTIFLSQSQFRDFRFTGLRDELNAAPTLGKTEPPLAPSAGCRVISGGASALALLSFPAFPGGCTVGY